jgi:hypothetical protein
VWGCYRQQLPRAGTTSAKVRFLSRTSSLRAENDDITKAFRGAGAFLAFANQARPQLGCMSCHNQARIAAVFIWTVLDMRIPQDLLRPVHSVTNGCENTPSLNNPAP